MAIIEVEQLSKSFPVKRRRPGVLGALAALVAAPVETRWAVQGVSLTVEAGATGMSPMPRTEPMARRGNMAET